MDPLSDVLSLLKPRSQVSGRFNLGRKSAIRFPTYSGIKCYAVLEGGCWLAVEGEADPVRVAAGDCFLLTTGRSFCLATDLSVNPVDFEVLVAALRSGRLIVEEGESGCCPGKNTRTTGPESSAPPEGQASSFAKGRGVAGPCALAGGHFLLEGEPTDILLGPLPPVVHLRTEGEKAALRWSLDRMREEVWDPQPGGSLVMQQLAYTMLVQALRVYLTGASSRGGVGWLYALSDPQMKKGIVCMHAEPAKRWTVGGLAECVGMSRSIFALRFKETVGSSPMEYLTRWRMLLAGDRLTSSGDSVMAIAASLGYESESAFGKAFKRVMGCSPRRYNVSRQDTKSAKKEVAYLGRVAR